MAIFRLAQNTLLKSMRIEAPSFLLQLPIPHVVSALDRLSICHWALYVVPLVRAPEFEPVSRTLV